MTMKQELYQNHGDHIDAIMPAAKFLKEHLRNIISESKVYRRVRTEVSIEELKSERTDVTALVHGTSPMRMLTLLAYSPQGKVNQFVSIYPILSGTIIRAHIERVLEWDNQLEATIECSVGDFAFAFFATDYYENKRAYIEGDEISLELSALGCKVKEAQRGFSFEGQQAIDWLAKIGETPKYSKDGSVEPGKVSAEKLVAFMNHDEKCPDEAAFQSPAVGISKSEIIGIGFYRTMITIHRDENDKAISIPLYFRKDMCPNIKSKDPISGWIWVVGNIYSQS